MSLTLKVLAVDLGATKAIQLSPEWSIQEVAGVVREKFGDQTGGADHGLFLPSQRLWMSPAKLLDFYDLQSGDTIEYKKKHRPLRIQTLDGTTKTVIVDESLPVLNLVTVVCEKFAISNPEEYSFAPDTPSEESEKNNKGKRPATATQDDAKWLNPKKTLPEQDIKNNERVILKKKFFVTDQNVDRNDPVQLNLLYNQNKESIIKGKYPCTSDEASQFAAIQFQIQYGNHDPSKHKPGFIKLNDYMPPEFVKSKDTEKKMYSEHKKLQGLNELNAKYRYVQLCRSLKTYGISFFMVKEKDPKKGKLQNVLLGVTRQNVVRLDPISKDILQQWPLTQIRRWAATPTHFSLDFGDYSTAYYTVQTAEGEQISRLISGYVEIIVKRRKDASKSTAAETEDVATVEEYVKPGRPNNVGVAAIKQHVAMTARMPTYSGDDSSPESGQWLLQSPTNEADVSFKARSQALSMMIDHAIANINSSRVDLSNPISLPPLGNDENALAWKAQTLDVNFTNLASQIASHLSLAGILVNHGHKSTYDTDFDQLSTVVGRLAANLNYLNQSIKMIAALNDSENARDSLYATAVKLSDSTKKICELLNSVMKGDPAVRSQFHEELINLAKQSTYLVTELKLEELADLAENDLPIYATNVVKVANELVAITKPLSKSLGKMELQQQIAQGMKSVYENTEQLMVCSTVVGPAINYQICKEHIYDGAAILKDALARLIELAALGEDENLRNTFFNAAKSMEDALLKLVDRTAKVGTGNENDANVRDQHYDAVVNSVDHLLNSLETPEQIIVAAKELTLATMQYVTLLKNVGPEENENPEKHTALIKELADSTSKIIAAAKELAIDISSENNLENLIFAAANLRKVATKTAGREGRDRAIIKLAKSLKNVVGSANNLGNACKASALSNRNQQNQIYLNQSSRKVLEVSPTLISALKSYKRDPMDFLNQTRLLQASKAVLNPGHLLILAAKDATPTVGDSNAQTELTNSTARYEADLKQLESIQHTVEYMNAEIGVDQAVKSVKNIQNELIAAKKSADTPSSLLKTDELGRPTDFNLATTIIAEMISKLGRAAEDGNEQGATIATTEAVVALQGLSHAAQFYAAGESDIGFRSQILTAAYGVADTLSSLIVVANDFETSNPKEISKLVNGASSALQEFMTSLPGQREIEESVDRIETLVSKLPQLSESIVADERFANLQRRLQTNAINYNSNVASLMMAVNGPVSGIQSVAKTLADNFKSLVEVAVGCAKASPTGNHAATVGSLNTVGELSMQMLSQIKENQRNHYNDRDLQDSLQQMTQEIMSQTHSILEATSAAIPGNVNYINAIQAIKSVSSTIDGVNSPEREPEAYNSTLQSLVEYSKTILNELSGLNAVKSNAADDFLIERIDKLADVISLLTQSVLDAAFLIGLSDPKSIPATAAITDVDQFLEFQREILGIIDAGPRASAFSDNLMNVSARLNDYCQEVAKIPTLTRKQKNAFRSMGKEIFNKAELVTIVSDDESQYNVEVRQLVDMLSEWVNYAKAPEFRATPAKISNDGMTAQKPVLDTLRLVNQSAESLLHSIKNMIMSKDDNLANELITQSKAMSELVRDLIKAASVHAPGQKQCEVAIGLIRKTTIPIDAAIVESAVQALKPLSSNQTLTVAENLRGMLPSIVLTADALKSSSNDLGFLVAELPNGWKKIVDETIIHASGLQDHGLQTQTLDNLKTLADDLLAFLVYGKSYATGALEVEDLDSHFQKVEDSIKLLMNTIEGPAGSSTEFSEFSSIIENTLQKINLKQVSDSKILDQQYVECVLSIESISRELAEAIGASLNSDHSLQELLHSGMNICERFVLLSDYLVASSLMTDNSDLGNELISVSVALSSTVLRFIENMRLSATKLGTDQVVRAKMGQTAREVSQNMAKAIFIAKKGSKSLNLCQSALEMIQDIVLDLDSMIMFVQAGQLDSIDPNDSFLVHKESLLSAAKMLTDKVKEFITTVNGTHEDLANLCMITAKAVETMINDVKRGVLAVSSSDKSMQEQLLTCSKTVSENVGAIVQESIQILSKGRSETVVNSLSDSIKSVFIAVAEQVRIIKLLADESSRGTRAVEVTMNHIQEILGSLNDKTENTGVSSPEEVALIAKQLATTAAAVVSAHISANRQNDLVNVTNNLQRLVEDIVRAGKGVVQKAPEPLQQEMTVRLTNTCTAIQRFLGIVQEGKGVSNVDARMQIQAAAKEVSTSVGDVVNTAVSLSQQGYFDPNDPNVLAEKELLSAALLIENSARKMVLDAAVTVPNNTAEPLHPMVENSIVESAKGVAASTSALIKSATELQREGIAEISESLVATSKTLARATQELLDITNQTVANGLSPDILLAVARGAIAETKNLFADLADTDPNSQAANLLKAACRSVVGAIEELMKNAEQIQKPKELEMPELSEENIGASQIQELEAQMAVVRMEKELQKARSRLAGMKSSDNSALEELAQKTMSRSPIDEQKFLKASVKLTVTTVDLSGASLKERINILKKAGLRDEKNYTAEYMGKSGSTMAKSPSGKTSGFVVGNRKVVAAPKHSYIPAVPRKNSDNNLRKTSSSNIAISIKSSNDAIANSRKQSQS